MNSKKRICQNCKTEFTIEPEDFLFYERVQVPPPTWCPNCRMQRRMAFRNERMLYRDACDLCGKNIISIYSSDKPFTVYCRECWRSDRWNPADFAMDYDLNQPFFKQYKELLRVVPRLNLVQMRDSINSEYANFVVSVKDVYLSQSILYGENIHYSRSVDYSKDCFDSLNCNHIEIGYEIIDGTRNSRSEFLIRSRNCINCSFLYDCAGCQDCFMSSNLRNKQYIFRNKQMTKEEYGKALEQVDFGSGAVLDEIKKEFKRLKETPINKFANILKSIDCVGDNIENSKNVKKCFDVYNAENAKYGSRIVDSKDAYDVYGSKAELVYESVASGLDSYNNRVMLYGDGVKESSYIEWCESSSNLFGCIALRKKQYCILNKQYSKDEYKKLLLKIIDQISTTIYKDTEGRTYAYGDFFPIELSPFTYNETLAQEYFPITKVEAIKNGYAWRDPDPSSHKPTTMADQLPDNIKDVPESITKEIIECESCKNVYRITLEELKFLQWRKIAPPRKCPECRYMERFIQRNPMKLWHRQCVCEIASHFHGKTRCPNEFETSYAPDRPETIYCEQCYNSEII